MSFFNAFNLFFGNTVYGTDQNDLIFGTFGADHLRGNGGNDLIFGLFGDDKISGGDGEDALFGGFGNDIIAGNKGDDRMYGGFGNDKLVWNNGDGSDLMDGGRGYDTVQVNFDTDLVNDDLQNSDVAEFSVTSTGIQFARVEVNGQSERGLFQLDIRNTEMQETNFGGGDDTAILKGDVLDQIALKLDGGDGIDTLDFFQAASAVNVDLAAGTIGADHSATNFENIVGTAFDDVIVGNDQDNIIRGGSGDDTMTGGEGADTFVFFLNDEGVDLILDFEFGVDSLEFNTTDPLVTSENLLGNLEQVGNDVELTLSNKVITFADVDMTGFSVDDFVIA